MSCVFFPARLPKDAWADSRKSTYDTPSFRIPHSQTSGLSRECNSWHYSPHQKVNWSSGYGFSTVRFDYNNNPVFCWSDFLPASLKILYDLQLFSPAPKMEQSKSSSRMLTILPKFYFLFPYAFTPFNWYNFFWFSV